MLALALCSLARSPTAYAGPPLVVDDPETLKLGHFELFTSFEFIKSGTARAYGTPVELTIGLGPDWECSINGSWQYLQDSSATPQVVNGVLSLEVGTKYRLLTESETMPVSLALSAKLRFPTSPNAKYAAQGKPVGSAFLIVARTLGKFTLNANLAYLIGGAQNQMQSNDALFFGLSAQRVFAKKYTVFAEAYAIPEMSHFRNAVINADGGLLWDLSDRYRLSFVVGRGFRSGGAEFYGNLGFLLSFGPGKGTN
ncbi:hypothetical protein AYO41_05145 [Verrucomicrobia bacterium SCGC AG-212-E04]|nr:hypothetical protein AYO41_05145 [Verrucomicrobia bacterium SCGC AG-212-E04]